jgi:hypothetical protein
MGFVDFVSNIQTGVFIAMLVWSAVGVIAWAIWQ